MSATPLLVTGAPGWLGDALLARLDANWQITCLLHPSIDPPQFCESHPNVEETVRADLSCGTGSPAFGCPCGGVVLHAAGIIHPRHTKDWYAVNRNGTLTLAKAAKAAGAKRFIYISSNAAQGKADSFSQALTEDMPCKPLSHYGRSKYEAEQGLLRLHEPGRFEVIILRPCMFYGPPVPARHVEIFKRIQNGRLPLVGGGQYARSVTYIEDLVSAVLLALEYPRVAGEIFNICDSKIYTTLEICEAMAAALEVKPRYLRLPSIMSSAAYIADRALGQLGFYNMNLHLLGEANWHVGCSSRKAEELLGFKSTLNVHEGYRRAVKWCREHNLI